MGEYRLNYTGDEINDAIGKALTASQPKHTHQMSEVQGLSLDGYATEDFVTEAIGNVQPGGFGLTKVWENPDPAESFGTNSIDSSVDVSVDISDAEHVGIIFNVVKGNALRSPLLIFPTETRQTYGVVVGALTENVFSRRVTIDKSANLITFGYGSKNGDTMDYYSGDFGIPLAIYTVTGSGSSGDSESVEELAQSIEEMRNIVNKKADAYDVTVKSEMIAVQDAIEAPAVNLMSYIEPVQDADGALTGYSSVELQKLGKNILLRTGSLPLSRNGVQFKDAGDGKISVSGTATANANFSICSYSAGNRTRIAAGTYTLTGGDANAKITLIVYASQDATENVATATSYALTQGTESVFSVPAGGGYFGVYVTVSKDKTANCVLEPKIETGAIASEYEPYSVTTITATLPEIVYEGTLEWNTGEVISTMDSDGNKFDEPRTLQITPHTINLAKGRNTFKSNSGYTEISYAADIRLYVDQKIASLAAAILRL